MSCYIITMIVLWYMLTMHFPYISTLAFFAWDEKCHIWCTLELLLCKLLWYDISKIMTCLLDRYPLLFIGLSVSPKSISLFTHNNMIHYVIFSMMICLLLPCSCTLVVYCIIYLYFLTLLCSLCISLNSMIWILWYSSLIHWHWLDGWYCLIFDILDTIVVIYDLY